VRSQRFYLTRFGFLWSTDCTGMMHYLDQAGHADLTNFRRIGKYNVRGISTDRDSGSLWCWRNDVFLLVEDDWDDDDFYPYHRKRLDEFLEEYGK